MYIFKNAMRNLFRMARRNVLIGIIVLAIAVSACIGLSVRRAAETAREEALSGMSITASISFDRQSMMNNFGGGKGQMGGMPGGQQGGGRFDRNDFINSMMGVSSLTLDDYKKYAAATSVSDFYYTLTAYINGSENFFPVSTEDSDEEEGGTLDGTITEDEGTSEEDFFPGGNMGMMPGGQMGSIPGMNSDFTVVGYSSDSAMTDFLSGNASFSEGSMFSEGEANFECIISTELAIFNDISVGDTVVISNPNNSEETYTLTVSGIYTKTATDNPLQMFGSTASDPANAIYTSYATLEAISESSKSANSASADTNKNTAINGTLSATYCFADAKSYYKFEEEVRTLGLSADYAVSSTDITAFESSMLPLDTLSDMAGTFLIVILLIGAVVLVVLNIFYIRERKYEIGVLTAMGMKKGKVALQFVTEIFAVTLVAVMIGAAVGAVSSLPVTNALLENQVSAQKNTSDRNEQNFGRQPGGPGGKGEMGGNMPSFPGSAGENGDFGGKGGFGEFAEKIFGEGSAAANYITEVSSATDFKVLFQMLGIALLLTVVSGAASMLFVMRYDPLKILTNRD